MVYLSTFALIITQMWVNIPYMEHMGYEINKNINQLFVDQGVFSCKKVR
jgi:inorganic pyrophosphatase